MNETQLINIRNTAIDFLYLDIEKTSIDFIVSHPFTNSVATMVNHELVDLRNQDNINKWRETMKDLLNRASFEEILMMMNPAYKLVFIKYIYEYLSPANLAIFLKDHWSTIEYANHDINVTPQEIIEWFQKVDKKLLMSKDELKHYNNLPDKVTVYRGVTDINKEQTKALSWTLQPETAQFFANRFQTGTGEVWKQTISKDKILCYWKYEDEVIVNLYKQGEKNE